MVMRDCEIRESIKITPWSECIDRPGIVSYGLSSYGYDVRVDRFYKVCDQFLDGKVMDVKDPSTMRFEDYEGDVCTIPAHGFVLATTLERIVMPDNVVGLCLGKSTYARVGIVVNATPLEPTWKGQVTIEISNTTPNPVKIYSGEGIAQIVFFRSPLPPEVTYASKKGKYMDQKGITLAKVL